VLPTRFDLTVNCQSILFGELLAAKSAFLRGLGVILGYYLFVARSADSGELDSLQLSVFRIGPCDNQYCNLRTPFPNPPSRWLVHSPFTLVEALCCFAGSGIAERVEK
jgi:hypothetical protein